MSALASGVLFDVPPRLNASHDTMRREATFDPTTLYRYSLRRCWDDTRTGVCWIMLNPSTADEFRDDPTVRRCINFSRQWGYGSLEVVNIFAYRATLPSDLWPLDDPIGPDNDAAIDAAAARASLVVAAWGTHGGYRGRGAEVAARLTGAKCLGLSKGGYPRHPLYVRGNVQLVEYGGSADAQD